MKYKKAILIIMLLFAVNLLMSEVNVTPIAHFAQAQHYGHKAITISDSIIVCRSVTGVDIFRILPDNDIFLESHLDILSPLTMRVQNNYIYLSSIIRTEENEIMRFSQIDITNISQPEIIRQIDYNYPERSVFIEIFNSNQLFMYEHITEELSIIHVYELPQMELISSIESNVRHLFALNDTIAHYYDDWGEEPTQNLQLFDVSNPLQIELIQEINVAQYHSVGGRPKEFVSYNDSILFAAGNTCITFWDISNFTNWEYVSQFIYEDGSNETMDSPTCIIENKLVIFDDSNIKLYDIEDINNIELLDFIQAEISNHTNMGRAYFKMKDDFLYVTGYKDGVHRYEINDNSIQYLGTNIEMPSFLYIIVNGYTIVAQSLDYGIYFFDLSDPENPTVIQNYLNYEYGVYIYCENNKLAVSYVEDGNCYFDLYDISDPYDVHLISQYPLELYEFVVSSNEDWSEIFIQSFDYNNSYFRKALITQAGNLENIYSYNPPSSFSFQIKDDYCYYISSSGNMVYLNVLNGLSSDYPTLINSIEIGNYTYEYMSLVINNSLLQFSSFIDDTTFFYDTINPPEPQFLTRLSQKTLSAGLAYHNHYFSANSNTSFIYDLNNPPPIVYPINQVISHTNIFMIKEMIINNEEYLIVDNQGSMEVWSLNITQSVEEELPKPKFTLSNYPNPFNPETNIVFNILEESKVELVIYNIKGQKIRSLLNDQITSGEHSIIWNGEDDSGKKVSSGVYLYKLQVNGKTEAVKKCLLLK